MTFGEFETVLSIIEKASWKDLHEIRDMIDRRVAVLKLLEDKKAELNNASETV